MAKTVTVHTERTFAIARSSTDSFERVILELEEDGERGLGEAAPTNYYGQTANDVAEALETVEIADPWDIEGALTTNEHLPSTALAALDNALYDLAAKRLGVPVYKLLGLAKPETQSAFTLGIAEPEETVSEARRLSSFPILKMKVGGWRDIETVKAVAEFSEAELWVDANEAFSPDEAVEAAIALREAGVFMIEQPIPASAGPLAMRRAMEAAHPVPLIADESSLVASDVPKLAGCVGGVNVKLAKCGGIRNAMKMVYTARAHGMLAMLGCMVETSVSIAAAAHISGLFDFVDLDGAMLLADDPYSGPTYENGRITLTDEPGLGVWER
ncbi:MAG: dipeptide epimerase [Rubrobacter sp.]|jgi:L-alanine-DL-glutamate epimerase-like enolase superfamily enzyme|nr:dipeptide epimerase [Rubrobacter sp.]